MSLLFNIFSDSFIILTRYFTLVYVFFLFLLLVGIFIPANAEPSLDPAWLALGLVMVLITFAFMAGWSSMIAKGCLTYLSGKRNGKTQEKTESAEDDRMPAQDFTLPIIDSFALLKEFFPGIGKHFVHFTLGGFINLGILALIIFLIQQTIDSMGPAMAQIQKMAEMDINQREAFIQKLTFSQLEQLSQLSLMIMGGVFAYGVFTLLTMFWPAFVIFHQHNVLLAYLQSIRQFFRDPFRVIAIGLFFVLGHILLIALFYSESVFLMVMLQFLTMILEIYTLVILFVYILSRLGKPGDLNLIQRSGESKPPLNNPPSS